MSKIKEIENLLSEWKADLENVQYDNNAIPSPNYLNGGVQALKSALFIVNEPSNTKMHVDTKPCKFCKSVKQATYYREENRNFCINCGRALS